MAQGSSAGLAQRGLLLLGLMVALAVAIWAVLLRSPRQQLPSEERKPQLVAALIEPPLASFPAAVPWGRVAELNEVMPSAPGWEIRYNATVALARSGSPRLPLDVLSEMLDEDRQMRNFRARLQNKREVPDETAARRTVLEGLKVFAEWCKHADAVKAVGASNRDLQKAYAAVEKLTRSPNNVVRTEAANVRLSLPKG